VGRIWIKVCGDIEKCRQSLIDKCEKPSKVNKEHASSDKGHNEIQEYLFTITLKIIQIMAIS